MEEFRIGNAWTQGYKFVAQGTGVHFLILVLIGIAAPIGVQYALVGEAFDGAASPMTSGETMMQFMGVPVILVALALSHVLQSGSYFASLRFGYDGARNPAGAVVFGLVAGCIATLVIAAGYLVAIFGARAIAAPGTLEIAVLILMLPLVVVYCLFFISQAIMGAATFLLIFAWAILIGLVTGYPESAIRAFGNGTLTVIILVMCGLLFWLAARFSCVNAVMAERGSVNVFGAIAESWRITSDEQWAITRYLLLVGLIIGAVVIGISLAIGASTGGLSGRGGLGLDTTGEMIMRFVLGVPLAFLSVMLSAGIHRALTGEETPAEIFE